MREIMLKILAAVEALAPAASTTSQESTKNEEPVTIVKESVTEEPVTEEPVEEPATTKTRSVSK